jgi:hypothetical protein
MSRIYNLLRVACFVSVIPNIQYMFLKSCFETVSCLTVVNILEIYTFKFINTALILFTVILIFPIRKFSIVLLLR